MAGINFNSNSFQLRATSLKKANVAPEAQKKEEEVKAGSEEKKPVIKTKIQNSSLNLLGNYNMVSVNTVAKKGTLKAAGVKPSIVNNDNQGDKKAENDVNEKLSIDEFNKRASAGTLKLGDYAIYQISQNNYAYIVYTNGPQWKYAVGSGSTTPEDAEETAKECGAKD